MDQVRPLTSLSQDELIARIEQYIVVVELRDAEIRELYAVNSALLAERDALDAECADLAHQLNQSNERNGVLRASLKECSAELFAQCGDQKRAMHYVERARAALAQEQA